jgi:hypothetical protein
MSKFMTNMELLITFFLLIMLLQHVNREYGIDHPIFLVWGTEDKQLYLTANNDATDMSL